VIIMARRARTILTRIVNVSGMMCMAYERP